jgi:hypothetical protein
MKSGYWQWVDGTVAVVYVYHNGLAGQFLELQQW